VAIVRGLDTTSVKVRLARYSPLQENGNRVQSIYLIEVPRGAVKERMDNQAHAVTSSLSKMMLRTAAERCCILWCSEEWAHDSEHSGGEECRSRNVVNVLSLTILAKLTNLADFLSSSFESRKFCLINSVH
jgi:hypothetical protein